MGLQTPVLLWLLMVVILVLYVAVLGFMWFN